MSVVRPLIQHNVLSRVAGALDERHRSDEDLPAARVVDVLTLVAAIVCGGEKVLVDPTVPDQTMDRTRGSAKVLGLEVDPKRPSTSNIAKAAQHGGSMLTEKSAVEVKLAPVSSSGSYPPNGPELTSGHLNLARKLADHVGESGGDELAQGDWVQMARWLCESEHDKSWGNKLLAGLCSRDASAAGRGESATVQYLADLRRAAPGWEPTPQAYWMTNARIAKFRSGFLPGIAREMGGMYYGQSTEDGISDRVEFFDQLAEEMLTRNGWPLVDAGALADTSATRALAWAAVRPILDASWSRKNPKGLIEAAKNYAGGYAARLMREAHRIELGEPIKDDLIERLSIDPDRFVHPRKPRSIKSLALALSTPTASGVIAYFSPYVTQSLEHFANPDGLVALGGVAAGGAVHFGVDRARRRRQKYDVSAANIFREFLNDETRENVERKLSSELGITS